MLGQLDKENLFFCCCCFSFIFFLFVFLSFFLALGTVLITQAHFDESLNLAKLDTYFRLPSILNLCNNLF